MKGNLHQMMCDLEHEVGIPGIGANIGGAPCGCLWVVIAVYAL